ncbi:MAG: molybdopterin-guanine dinucleotide biosynthesis protein B [Betaproteobacteria bacterium]|nr:molybdopterin-guanine dinucleotide biosynthesis protein B [Betaproteobacteria bacterium]
MKVFGFTGTSGSGKTTLVEQVIPCLIRRGWKVSLIKHAHHGFDLDRPGKDSYRHREAGCGEVMVTCGSRWALMHELRDETEPTLAEHLARFAPCDLVLVEGFKHEAIPKIEVHRPAHGKPPLWPENPHIVAVASDVALATSLPQLDINDPEAVAAFVVDYLEHQG